MFKTFIVLCAIAFTLTISHQLTSYNVDRSQWGSLQPIEFAEQVANSQPEILRKIVLHYLTEKIAELRDRMNKDKVNQQISQWFQSDRLEELQGNLHSYMKSKLFSKLEMEKLSQSFKDEIEKNPEAYFLTYDMYDLLID